MICDSWECVGSWFGSGGGAAWVQALLTAGVFWWSIVSFRKGQKWAQNLHEKELEVARNNAINERQRLQNQDRIAAIKNMARLRLSLSTCHKQMEIIQGDLPETATKGLDREISARVGRSLMLKHIDSFFYLNQLDFPDIKFYEIINNALINTSGLTELLREIASQGGGGTRSQVRAFVNTAKELVENADKRIKASAVTVEPESLSKHD